MKAMRWLTIGCLLPLLTACDARRSERIVDASAVCDTCNPTLTRIATLGTLDGPGALRGEPRFLLALPDGRYLLAEYPLATRLVVFNPDGSFDRVLGRQGQAPGEFEFIGTGYLDQSGRVHVADEGLNRETTFDAQLRLAGVQRLPQFARAHGIAVGPDAGVYYNADLLTSEASGLPIHLIDGETVNLSFGGEVAPLRQDWPWLGQRPMASVPGGIWLARRTEYRLERWTSKGARTDVLTRQAEWFPPYEERQSITPDLPPKPWLTALKQSGSDVLIALIGVAARDFPERLRVQERRGNRVIYDLSDCSDYGDTIIEVIDASAGRLLSSTRVDECLIGFTGDNIYGYRLSEGVPQIDVYKLDISVK